LFIAIEQAAFCFYAESNKRLDFVAAILYSYKLNDNGKTKLKFL